MSARLSALWFWLRSSYWFVPLVMTVGAIALAVGLVAFDQSVGRSLELPSWVYTGSPEGARALLSAVAGSMITVAGVVFSITVVALALTSSQFGPRLLINFMRDSGNQLVLGVFVATFMYCLMVLRVVRSGTPEFVPHFSITAALLLAAAGVFVLIYFIHHVAVAIQADNVIVAVRGDLGAAIDAVLGGETQGEPAESPAGAAGFDDDAVPLAAQRSGYVQAVDAAALVRLAAARDLRIRLHHRAGHFVVAGSTLAHAAPAQHAGDDLAASLDGSVVIGAQRTPIQDPEFAVSQLVEIAIRALSPGINDPFTAIACIDWLAEGLCRLASGELPRAEHYDERGVLRVVVTPITFAGIVDAAFNQIRQYGRSSAAVTIRLLEAITSIAERVRRDDDRRALRRQVMMIARGTTDAIPEELDRETVYERFRVAVAALGGEAP